jgi:hypothetical protein
MIILTFVFHSKTYIKRKWGRHVRKTKITSGENNLRIKLSYSFMYCWTECFSRRYWLCGNDQVWVSLWTKWHRSRFFWVLRFSLSNRHPSIASFSSITAPLVCLPTSPTALQPRNPTLTSPLPWGLKISRIHKEFWMFNFLIVQSFVTLLRYFFLSQLIQ